VADNLTIRDGGGTSRTLGAKDISSVYHPYQIRTDASGNVTPAGDAVGRAVVVKVGDGTTLQSFVDVDGAIDERTDHYVASAAALMATDSAASAGAKLVPVQCVSTAVPILKEVPYDAAGTALYGVAAAMADALANPTIGKIGVLPLVFNGATWDRERTPNVFKDVSAVTVTTIATVWTPASGKKFRLMGGVISASAAMNVLFEDNSAGAGNFVFRTPKLLADTPFAFTLGGNGKISATVDNVLKATGSAAGAITGTLYGVEE